MNTEPRVGNDIFVASYYSREEISCSEVVGTDKLARRYHLNGVTVRTAQIIILKSTLRGGFRGAVIAGGAVTSIKK
jgi:hypothetical protein